VTWGSRCLPCIVEDVLSNINGTRDGFSTYNVYVVYRDDRGVEYIPVPLPTHEVTGAVALDARRLSRTTKRASVELYTGTDGAELAQQPRSHRRRWTDRQWLAFEEHRSVEEERSQEEAPRAAVWVVRSHDSDTESA